jgi:phage portal protein BeeE
MLVRSLLRTDEVQAGDYVQFDRDEIASVALEARANFYKAMREMQVLSANEVRAELGYAKTDDAASDQYNNPAIAPRTETTTL